MTGRVLFFAAAGLLLVACQPKEESAADRAIDAETAEATTAPSSDAASSGPAAEPAVQRRISEVVDARIVETTLSDRGDPETGVIGSPKTTFQPADTVYVSVETDGTAKEYVLYAKWLDGQGEVLSEYGLNIDQAGRQRRVLSLSKPDGWSAGRYAVELAINDGSRRPVNFEVASP